MAKQGVLLAAILAPACAFAYWLGGQGTLREDADDVTQESPLLISGLTLQRPNLDLGELWEEKEAHCEIPVTNTTDHSIKILDFLTSAGCCMSVSISPRQLTIPPQHTAKLQLRLDTRQRSGRELGMSRRPLRVDLMPLVRFGEPKSWVFTGVIKSRVTLDALSLDFGDRPVHGEAPVTHKVLATAHVPLQRLEARVNTAIATVHVVSGADDRHFDILISTVPSRRPGKFATEVTLHAQGEDGTHLQVGSLSIMGNVQPEIPLLPARLFLPSVTVGTTSEGVVVLQAPANAKIIVEKVEADSPDVLVTPVSMEGVVPGRAFRISRNVTKEGDEETVVRFVVRKDSNRPTTVALDVLSHGQRNRPEPR